MGHRPLVKWVGGKRQLLNEIKSRMPYHYNTYFEPFVGGGALLFDELPYKAVISDINTELIYLYETVRDYYALNELVALLDYHKANHSEEYYNEIRAMDRQPNFNSLPKVVRAARLMYLNKTCFNGMYRVSSQGYYNVPMDKGRKEISLYGNNIYNIFSYLVNSRIVILNADFESAVATAKSGDFVYFDPPYDKTRIDSFTKYARGDFDQAAQERLAKVFKELTARGVYVMLSNSNTEFVRQLYDGYNIEVIKARRSINSDGEKRGRVDEVLIRNYVNSDESKLILNESK